MTFEKVFEIPIGHKLQQLSFRQKGTLAQDEYWEHKELDAEGNMVAKYESWHCTSIKPPFLTTSGFIKYNTNNMEVSRSDSFPI